MSHITAWEVPVKKGYYVIIVNKLAEYDVICRSEWMWHTRNFLNAYMMIYTLTILYG